MREWLLVLWYFIIAIVIEKYSHASYLYPFTKKIYLEESEIRMDSTPSGIQISLSPANSHFRNCSFVLVRTFIEKDKEQLVFVCFYVLLNGAHVLGFHLFQNVSI